MHLIPALTTKRNQTGNRKIVPPKLIEAVLDIFAQIDAETAAFRLASGLRCPDGCGACCRSNKVRSTVLEMLPAAAEILRQDEGAHWLEAIDTATETAACAAFSGEKLLSSGGHCRLYPLRPSICRLFAFAAVAGRQGKPELAACKEMKHSAPQGVKRVVEAVSQGLLRPPIFSGYSIRLAALEPILGARLVPINQALRQAIQRLGLSGQFDPSPGVREAGPRMAA